MPFGSLIQFLESSKSAFDRWQQRHRVTAIPVAMIKKFTDDRAGRLAALIAYYGFLSIFPAMLAFVTILGFILEGRPELRADLADSALAQIPIVGARLDASVSEPLNGSTWALVIGLTVAIWAGLGAMQAGQDAMNEVWDVPRRDYPNFFLKRARSLALLIFFALLVVSSTLLSQIGQFVASGVLRNVVVLPLVITFNIAAFEVVFRILTVARPPWRQILPGACVAGAAYTVLQRLGGVYVNRLLTRAEQTYGSFALVIGLVSWIFLMAQVSVLATELNVVLARRLWPRTFFGRPTSSSDRRSLAAQAHEQSMDDSMSVIVQFDSTPGESEVDEARPRR